VRVISQCYKSFLSVLSFVLVIGAFSISFAQQSSLITRVSNTEAVEGSSFDIFVELVPSGSIKELDLFYGKFGQTEWKTIDFVLSGTNAKVTIPASDVSLPSVEYYVIALLENGTIES